MDFSGVRKKRVKTVNFARKWHFHLINFSYLFIKSKVMMLETKKVHHNILIKYLMKISKTFDYF